MSVKRLVPLHAVVLEDNPESVSTFANGAEASDI